MLTNRIIISFLSLAIVASGALYGLYYYAPQDLGLYPVTGTGSVKGASVERFQLPSNEVFLSSRRAAKPLDADVLILTAVPADGVNRVYVIRDEHIVLLDQRIAIEYTHVTWRDSVGFELISQHGSQIVSPSEDGTTYSLRAE